MIPFWKNAHDKAGTFGDMFGAITSILSFATVLILIISLNYQREELELTRDEIIKQRETNQKIQRTARLQRIENTFFNLLDMHINTKSKIYIQDELNSVVGRFSFKEAVENKVPIINIRPSGSDDGFVDFDILDIESLRVLYNQRDSFRSDVANYYNTTLNILKFINECGLVLKRKLFFLNTFSSLLSAKELAIVFMYIRLKLDDSSKTIEPALYDFVDRHKFFNNIDVNDFPSESFLNLLKRKTA